MGPRVAQAVTRGGGAEASAACGCAGRVPVPVPVAVPVLVPGRERGGVEGPRRAAAISHLPAPSLGSNGRAGASQALREARFPRRGAGERPGTRCRPRPIPAPSHPGAVTPVSPFLSLSPQFATVYKARDKNTNQIVAIKKVGVGVPPSPRRGRLVSVLYFPGPQWLGERSFFICSVFSKHPASAAFNTAFF